MSIDVQRSFIDFCGVTGTGDTGRRPRYEAADERAGRAAYDGAAVNSVEQPSSPCPSISIFSR